MNKLLIATILLTTGISTTGLAQDTVVITGFPYTIERHNNNYLSGRNFTRSMNRSFGRVAVGSFNGASLSNFATADLAAGNFSFNGFGCLTGDSSHHPVFISMSVKGGLKGTNTTELFTNSKLNTTASVNLSFHFGMSKEGISFAGDKKELLDGKRDSLYYDALYKLRSLRAKVASNEQLIREAKQKEAVIQYQLDQQNAVLTNLQQRATIFYENKETAGYPDSLSRYNDSISKTRASLAQLDKALYSNSRKLDSLNKDRKDISHIIKPRDPKKHYLPQTKYGHDQFIQINQSYEDQIDTAELKAPLFTTHFLWYTLNLGFNRQKYYTFSEALAFSDQIGKQYLDAFNIGVAVNFFHQNFQNGRIKYANLGISKLRNNNTDELSTTEVDEENDYESAKSKRKTVVKYNAYTDPIIEFKSWLTYANFYYMWGTRDKSAIHIFPEIEFRDDYQARTNAGLGYIFSFTDKKDSKSMINVEAYVKFKDIANTQKDGSHFYNRNTIGVSIGMPFNFIF